MMACLSLSAPLPPGFALTPALVYPAKCAPKCLPLLFSLLSSVLASVSGRFSPTDGKDVHAEKNKAPLPTKKKSSKKAKTLLAITSSKLQSLNSNPGHPTSSVTLIISTDIDDAPPSRTQ